MTPRRTAIKGAAHQVSGRGCASFTWVTFKLGAMLSRLLSQPGCCRSHRESMSLTRGLMLSRRLRRWEGSESGRESMAPLIENFPPKYQMHTQRPYTMI